MHKLMMNCIEANILTGCGKDETIFIPVKPFHVIITRLIKTPRRTTAERTSRFPEELYSTIDLRFTLTQLIEGANEYKLLLRLAFVDYGKVFDSVEMNAKLKSLEMQSIEAKYVKLLRDENSGCTTDSTHLSPAARAPMEKGVKQGDTISSKIFTACLEMVITNISWTGGVDINGEQLKHLRLVDDTVLITETTDQLQPTLTELSIYSLVVSLKMNQTETNICGQKT
ncbi:uncharacterized protein LOC106867945 [Octopus bimaculoides]|uniref:uncharacterized protein LOC106867945 n=1 Tax=Octopus bimaculoides TaxID=37653 RepID=UPI00071E284E|nr:uncharacterized protein LOC106867945 [Octopus bimaculoides]|eukprot:XP_014768500.1 PREDICTED: uncharacterized protein LOC106867945 [Octopus bimaculoides]